MQRHARLLLALMLAFAPGVGAAEIPAGAGLVPPVRPFAHGFSSLFQSAAPPTMRGPAGLVPPNAPAPTAPRRDPRMAAGVTAPGGVCRPALIAAEARYGIPSGLLQAIGVVESGRRDEGTGTRQPWPWTINAEGEPHVFDTKEQAVAWVRQAQARGIRSIDTGCAQVNLMHHPGAFASVEEAFDPAANADYAARFLRQLRETSAGGNWMTAVGYYHSQTPELADGYRAQVQAVVSRGAVPGSQAPGAAVALQPSSPFGPVGRELPMGVPPGPARVLAAPVGTVGRGLDAYRATPIQLAVITRPVVNSVGANSVR